VSKVILPSENGRIRRYFARLKSGKQLQKYMRQCTLFGRE